MSHEGMFQQRLGDPEDKFLASILLRLFRPER
jgi:hypothetical protein